MIRDLLELLFIQRLSISEVAKRWDVEVKDLQNRVDQLAHLGYLRKINLNGKGCEDSCAGCLIFKSCHDEHPSKRSSISGFVGYELTEKGKRLLDILQD